MHHKNKHILINCCIIVTVAVVLISTCAIVLKFTRGSRVFKKYVCNPIPKSVRNIKTHGQGWPSWEIFSHKYVMHFKIGEADLPLILGSKQFKEVEWFKYKNGSLEWGDTPPWEKKIEGWSSGVGPAPHWEGEGLSLYPRYKGRPGPAWFKPNDWDSPKVYIFKERYVSYQKHIQFFIYNEDIDEAYLIEYQEGHW